MIISSRKLSTFAAATLLAWIGAVYHDVWLEVFEIAHLHHEHSDSHHDQHDSRDNGGHEDGEDALILPDIHSSPFVAKGISGVSSSVWSIDKIAVTVSIWIESLGLLGEHCTNAPPPDWVLSSESGSANLLLLTHCVQSNAPPSIA